MEKKESKQVACSKNEGYKCPKYYEGCCIYTNYCDFQMPRDSRKSLKSLGKVYLKSI